MKPLQLSPETALKLSEKLNVPIRTAYAYASAYSHSKTNGIRKGNTIK